MIPEEIIKKIKTINIKARKPVEEVIGGNYQSVFRGRGIEVREVREYQWGDEIRIIDWNVTARLGKPYVKVFEEERELVLMILIDLSGSINFGSREQTKREYMTELVALFSLSAVKNNDRVGSIIFTDRIEKYIHPDKEITHVLRVLREVLYFTPESKKTDLRVGFEFLNHMEKRRCIALVISDFLSEPCTKIFKLTAKRHDIIPIIISDPIERNIYSYGAVYNLRDLENEKTGYVDFSNQHVGKKFLDSINSKIKSWKDLFTSTGVDFIELSTDEPYLGKIFEFFHKRMTKFRT